MGAILIGIACPPTDGVAQTAESRSPDGDGPDPVFAATVARAAKTRQPIRTFSVPIADATAAAEDAAPHSEPGGSPAPAVREIQVLLDALGFELDVADGVADRRTREALDAFYRRSGRPSRTTFDQATLNDLLDESLRYVEARRALERAREALSRGEPSLAVAALGEAKRTSSLLHVPPDLRREIGRLPAGDGERDAIGREPVGSDAEIDGDASSRARELVDELTWDAVRISRGGDHETALRLLEEAERVANRPADTDELLARLRETIARTASGARRSTRLSELLERAEAIVDESGSARGERFDAYLDELSLAIDSLFEAPASD